MDKQSSYFNSMLWWAMSGIVIGFSIVFFEAIFLDAKSLSYNNVSPKMILWIASIAVKVGVWFTFIPSCLRAMKQLCPLTGAQDLKEGVRRSGKIFFSIYGMILLLHLLLLVSPMLIAGAPNLETLFSSLNNGIENTFWKNVVFLNLLGFGIAVFPVMQLSMVIFSIQRLKRKKRYELHSYLQLLEKLKSTILLLGVFLSLLVITVAFQQQAMDELMAQRKIAPAPIKSFSISYGIFYAFIMLIIYIPAKMSLVAYGKEVRNNYLVRMKRYDKYIEGYEQMSKSLDLTQSLQKNFLSILGVIAPFLSGTLPTIIEKITSDGAG